METVKVQEVVNVPIMLSDEMINAIADRINQRNSELNELIDARIEYFFDHHFDINDFSNDLDLYDIKRSLVDDVIDTIKDRL